MLMGECYIFKRTLTSNRILTADPHSVSRKGRVIVELNPLL